VAPDLDPNATDTSPARHPRPCRVSILWQP